MAGTALIIGLRKTGRFFFRWQKLRGTVFFFTGILMIIVFGYTFVGLLVEAFGFVSLFGYVKSGLESHPFQFNALTNRFLVAETLFPWRW